MRSRDRRTRGARSSAVDTDSEYARIRPPGTEEDTAKVPDDDGTYVAKVADPGCCLPTNHGLQHGESGSSGGFAVIVGTLGIPVRSKNQCRAVVPRIMEFFSQSGKKVAGVILGRGAGQDCDEA